MQRVRIAVTELVYLLATLQEVLDVTGGLSGTTTVRANVVLLRPALERLDETGRGPAYVKMKLSRFTVRQRHAGVLHSTYRQANVQVIRTLVPYKGKVHFLGTKAKLGTFRVRAERTQHRWSTRPYRRPGQSPLHALAYYPCFRLETHPVALPTSSGCQGRGRAGCKTMKRNKTRETTSECHRPAHIWDDDMRAHPPAASTSVSIAKHLTRL